MRKADHRTNMTRFAEKYQKQDTTQIIKVEVNLLTLLGTSQITSAP